MPENSALVIGNATDPEFSQVVQRLQNRLAIEVTPSCQAALEAAAAWKNDPVCIVLLQKRPSQFAEADIQVIQRRFPLARIIAVLSSWCEGELRTGAPLPGIERISAIDLTARCIRSSDSTFWFETQLPPTASADEVWLARSQQPLPALHGLALVVSADPVLGEGLLEPLATTGLGVVVLPPDAIPTTSTAKVIVYNTAADLERRQQELTAWRNLGAPVIALLDGPRPHEVTELEAMGVKGVLGKPFALQDLLALVAAVAFSRFATESSSPPANSTSSTPGS